MSWSAGIDGARERIRVVRNAAAAGMRPDVAIRQPAGVVHFETGGQSYDVPTVAGVPQDIVLRGDTPPWAVVVDRAELIAPLHPPIGISELRQCTIRLGEERHALPFHFEVDNWSDSNFPKRIKNALLYCYLELHGTPVGSVSYAIRFDEGLPRVIADGPDVPLDQPRMALGTSWTKYHEYRRGRAHQLSLAANAWLDGNWKDLLTLHGLYDAEGFARVYAEYPTLPSALIDYCSVMAEAAKLPEAKPPEPEATTAG